VGFVRTDLTVGHLHLFLDLWLGRVRDRAPKPGLENETAGITASEVADDRPRGPPPVYLGRRYYLNYPDHARFDYCAFDVRTRESLGKPGHNRSDTSRVHRALHPFR
jgi:hypothetical protein